MFSQNEINTGRQDFLDIAKSICIVFMIHVHMVEYGTSDYESLHPLLFLISFLFTGGVFTAPVFMFCMGCGIAYSLDTSPGVLARRGLSLGIKGLSLNMLRGGLLCLIIYLITKEPLWRELFFYNATDVDIMEFAAMAFFLMALLRKLRLSAKGILFIAVLLSIFGSYFRYIETDSFASTALLGFFVGTVAEHYESAFPLCNWFIFVAAGYMYGGFLRRCTDVRGFLLRSFVPALMVMVAYNAYALPNSCGIYSDENSYYFLTLIDALYAMAAIFVMLSVSYYISLHASPRLLHICRFMGRNLNTIYCIHWVVFIQFFEFIQKSPLKLSLNVFELHIIILLIIIGSVGLAKLWVDWQKARRAA